MAGKLEAAFDADRSADPESWTWTDLTDLTEANATAVSRGKPSSRGTIAEPASATFPLRNGGGDSGVTVGSLTPRKASGDWYPNVRKGLPLRFSYNVGASTLALTGATSSRASTPDDASLDITGDIAIAVQFRSPIRPGVFGGANDLIGKWGAAGQRSWRILMGQGGTFNFQWSADGTATTGEAATLLAIPSPDAGPLTVAIEFDSATGDGTFYVLKGTITELLASPSSYLFGDPDLGGGATSIFSSTAQLDVGNMANSGFAGYAGCVDRVFVRDGSLSAGTIAADADFTAEAAGTTSFADDAATPKTWTVTSPATVTDRKIRLLGEYGGNRGDYPGRGVDGTARRAITVAGPLRRMRQGQKPLQSALYRRITAPANDTTVYAYWPLEDGRDATSIYSIGGTGTGTVSMSLASDDTLASSNPLPTVSGGQPYGWNLRCPALAPTDAWEATMLIRIPVAPDSGTSEFIDMQRVDCTGGVTSQWVLRIDDTNVSVFAKDLDGTNVLSTTFPSDARMFDTWMIVSLAVGLSGLNITWDVDIIPLDLGVIFGGNGTLASLGLAPGSPIGLLTLDDAVPQDGLSAGHFTITSGAVAGWLSPADTAYVGEPDTSRVFRLCRELGIPASVDGPHAVGTTTGWPAALAAGAQPMGPQRPLPLLTLLEECAVVGNGYLGESREQLGIWYRTGVTLENQTPALTATTEVTDPFVSNDDDQDYVNSVEVSRPLGSKATLVATGDDDPATIGLYEASREVNVSADSSLADHASWWIHEATWPEERHDTIPLDIATTSTSQLAAFHDLSVGDVIEATALPTAAAETEVAQLVDGWVETDSPFLWSIRPNTRPAGPWQVGIRDDDDLAKRDTDGSILDAAFDAGTDTSMDVDVTAGQFWTTAAGDYPLELNVGGCRVTASACGAPAGSVQTFTVSATIVNGVNKTVPAGTAVKLWRPTIRAN